MADIKNGIATQNPKAGTVFVHEEDIKTALQSITVDVKVGEFKGKNVSLWDLIHSKYITEDKRQELLKNYKLTVNEIISIIIKTIEEVEKKMNKELGLGTENFDASMINTFKSKTIDVSIGAYKGQKVTVWELLNSKYITDEKRKELLWKYQSGKLTDPELLKIITTIIEETEERTSQLKFKGLRRQVTATELLTSEIIDQMTLNELTQGRKTVEQVTQMDQVKRYLEGTSCIAGVFVPSMKDPSKKEKMSIYQAMWKRILRPGTALVLLEAQAATGFIIDPLKNSKLSVDEAVAADVIGRELHAKLLSAEKGVTGYTDPYTGQKISLFQAMNKDLIVKDHGIRLLEAQIATGGIIDPVHSHRVPVEVAYKRGYFDEEMNQILSDPSDDTKGFFDPNTHANLTYMQLLERCVRDPETGLYMLEVVEKGSKDSFGDTKMPAIFKTKFTHVTVGHYKGQDVSVWELLHSYYFSEEKRQEILLKYKSGAITIDQVITELINIIKETEEHNLNGTPVSEADQTKTSMQSKIVDVTVGEFKGQKPSVWDLLNSKYIPEEKRKELLEKYTSGKLSIEDLVQTINNIIKETEEKVISEQGLTVQSGVVTRQQLNEAEQLNSRDQINRALKFITVDITTGDFQEEKKTVWEILHSETIPTDERNNSLKKHKTTVEEMIKSLFVTIAKIEHETGDDAKDEEIKKAMQSITVDVKVGQYRGQKVTLWDLLHSKYITEKQREELMKNYKLTIKEITDIIMRTIEETEEKKKKKGSSNLNETDYAMSKETGALKSATIDVTIGAFKGQKVSVWELLNSKYISEEKRNELLRKFQSGELTESELITIITTIIEETEERSSKLKFKGLRRQITATELLTSEIIDQKTLNELTQGSKTVEEVTQMDLVKRYLEGTSCIAGVFVPSMKDPSKKEKMSIYQAMWKRILRPGTALVLLEAQAATGFIIDPLKNTKLSVDEAVAADVIGQELHAKLLSAEKGVTGYTDPYTDQKISLFQAMNKDLIVKDHGIRLLEAQIATGGIIDPVHSHRVPVEVAYKRGYFDEEMNQILSDPSDDTKGFFDPNTHENLTYMQLLERCVRDPETGLYMLEVVEKGSKDSFGDTKMPAIFKTKFTHVTVGHYKGQDVSVWELIHSYYFSEEKRQEILLKYKSGSITIEELITELITIIKETEEHNFNDPPANEADRADSAKKSMQSKTIEVTLGEFKGQKLSVWDLLNSKYVSEDKRNELLEKYTSGKLSIEDLVQTISNIIKKTEEKVVSEQGLPVQSIAVTSQHLNEEEQLNSKDQINRALKFIKVDITTGAVQEEKKTVWEILHSDRIPTGERNNSLKKHKTTVEEMIKSLFTTIEKTEHETGDDAKEEEIKKALQSITVDVKVGQYRGQKVTVWDLLHSKYITEKQREELLKNYKLTIKEIIYIIIKTIEETEERRKKKGSSNLNETDYAMNKETGALKSATIDVTTGAFKGQKVSVWELLNSKYISEEKKNELLRKFQSGELTESELITIITTIIEETEERSSKLKFKGLRRQITATELLTSEIIDQKTLNELTQGSKTVEEVTKMDLVKRYLEGTSCIAGVFVPSMKDPSKKEKMSIYQAMWKRILRPGTALVLLEAQAATGFIIDPLKNTKLSVDEAVEADVIGQELHAKLLSAEKGVTGYTDPYTGQKISLFQAMNKDLIVKDHGIRLLEAQIATGGIIDPVHSHRVPVEVAYKRGYFDEEMNQILSDPSDDTKGFFDPNTHANLTYMQLLERCVRDPETGLYMLEVVEKGSKDSFGDTKMPAIFKTKFTHVTVGHYKGQDVSVWELIHSYYFSEEKRQEILLKYKSGSITIEELITELITIIKETEEHNFNDPPASEADKADSAKKSMQSKTIDVTLGEFKGQKLSVWDLLNSKYVSEDKRNELLEKYTSGKLSIEDLVQTISNIIKKTEEKVVSEQGLPVQSIAVTSQHFNEEEQLNSKDQINRALKFIKVDITSGAVQEEKKTVWEILHSENIPTDERNNSLKKHKTTVKEIIKFLVDTIEKTENETGDTAHEDEIKKALQSITVDVKVGQYRGQKVTVWDLLHSKYITEKERQDLLKNYKLTIKEIIYTIINTIEKTEERRKKTGSSNLKESDYTVNEETTLKSTTIEVTIGAYKGQKVTVWELLNSKYISEEKRNELLQKFHSGALTQSELITIITTIIEETEERSSKLKFKGLRRQVTATELLNSEIIDQKTLNELTQGSKTVEEVTQMNLVKRYLEGTSCIAGVFVPSMKDPSKKEKMSIYQAMWKRILRPGTALVLLEAQAATGFIIDPLKNTKLSVDEAVAADIIGRELHAKLLSAEKGVTGYTDPYTGQKISLFQAMNKDLIVKDHGIRLLEAQIATGGIIDPVHSHRVPVEVAYKRGYFDEEMNQILSDPSDDTKGFFDPNTHANLTYMQLLERCVRDPETGLYMLEVVEKGSKDSFGDTKMPAIFKTKFTHVTVGHYKGQDVSVWELIHSYYFSEEKRQEILLKYKSGSITIEELITELITIIKETEEHNFNDPPASEADRADSAKKSMQSKTIEVTLGEFKGQKLSVWDLLNSKYVSEDKRNELLEKYTSGKLSIEDLVQTISNIIKKTEEKVVSEQGLPVQSIAVTSQHLNEEEQLNSKDQINRALKFIKVDITTGAVQEEKKTVWEILHSDRIPTGERNNSLKKHKTTVEEMIKSLFTTIEKTEHETGDDAKEEEIKTALQSITVDVKVGQYRGQKVTVWDLLHSKYITEKQREELLKNYKLTIKEIINIITRTIEETEDKIKKRGSSNLNDTDYSTNEEITTLKSITIEVTEGSFKGQKVTVWELLNSKYISEEKRKELLQKFQAGELTESELTTIITTIIEETEKRSSKLKFKGLRRQVTATELLTSEIIDQKTLNELTQGRKTVEEVTQMDLVKRYLEGTSCIAGVFVPSLKDPSKKEKMSIYQAMWKRILRPGTALVLLEAQAATGFIIDPLKNTKLSVDEAVAADVIGQELHAKLLSAEKGVTGYTDPYTGQKISLFQAMNKDLIVKDHGIRLLEAQIATGGIIDPVHSHRVPVEVAYKRGYFDEEMNQILSDPSDDTKGFFDPNTHENLTYMQLLERCVQDVETGLYMLEVAESVDKNMQMLFQTKLVHMDMGHFQGQDVSVWQLLHSQYFTEEKRQEIFRKYKSGTLTIDKLITEVISFVKEREAQIVVSGVNVATEAKLNLSVKKDEKLQQFQSQTIDVTLGEFKGQKLSVSDLLHSKYFSPERRKELLDKYNSGSMSIEDICFEISTIIKETEERVMHEQSSETLSEAKTTSQADSKEQIDRALQFISTNVTTGEFEGQKKSLWELLNSKYTGIEKRKILLEKHRSTVEEIRKVLTSAVEGAEYQSGTNEQFQNSLQSKIIDISVGEYRGKKISVWDLLNSKDISDEKRKELLEKYKSGMLTLEELITAITAILEISDPSDEQLRKALQDVMVDVPEGKYRGKNVSVWNLLQSEYIIEDKRLELLKKCRFTVREITTIVTSIVNEIGGVKMGLDFSDVMMTSQFDEADSTQRDEQTQKTMKSTFVEIPVGELKGQKLSLWDIFESNYISQLKKSELLEKYQTGTVTLDEITSTLITIIEKTEERRSMLMFKGLRRQISAAELLSSEIIDQKTLNELTQGSKTLEEVTQTASVRRYLEGTSCIAGVLVPLKKDASKKEKMSIHQAMQKNILRPGTALVLLEAQAATGFVIDPLQNRKLSVDDAVSAGVVGQDLHVKLLSAEKAVTGYTDPYTGNKISLFQAMNKDLIVKDHGIRLLEAQIATGGIIDPVHSHRVPVEVAYKRGYFDEEMNQILSDPSDDTKGFFDPNTHENLTYMQLLERCVQDAETGLHMLDIVQKGSSWFQIDKPLQKSMQSRLVHVSVGKFQRETVSVWDLFFSRYITEEKRQDLLKKYKSGTLSFEQLTVVLTTIINENESESNRENMNVTIKKQEKENLQQSMSFISESKNSHENVNIAIKEQKAENKNQLIYGNGDTTVIESKGQGHSERDHDAKEAREDQIKKTLKYFYVSFTDGSFQGQTPTLWALLTSKHIPEDRKQVLYKKYILTIEEVISIITSIIKEREHSSSNLRSTNNEVSLVTDEQRVILQAAHIDVTVGEFSGQRLSVWELLNSKYISEEKRNELMAKYNSGELTLEELIRILTTIIVETEERSSKLKFRGLRRQVTASELLSSEIIDQKTLNELTQGNKTLEEVTQMDSVKRYLEGTNCIAGVLVPTKKDPSQLEKMSIYEAMSKRILRPGTALVLLEAQAATGFMINPVTNEKLSVDEAVSAGLVGQELHAKLLSAEKAVTGYIDPYTEQKISLFQAMHKDLIVKDHGIRLLEAQIATGGIIDPVHSHRVPVEVAYKRGYFDEEMNQILSDPSDDTKGFFDPNTHENLTYMQLVERGIQDADTGLCLLSVNKK